MQVKVSLKKVWRQGIEAARSETHTLNNFCFTTVCEGSGPVIIFLLLWFGLFSGLFGERCKIISG